MIQEMAAALADPHFGPAQAEAFLGRLHGECYADAAALRDDLACLEANGFCSATR